MFTSYIQNLNQNLLQVSSKLDNCVNISAYEIEEHKSYFSSIIDRCLTEAKNLMSKLQESEQNEDSTSINQEDCDLEKGTITREMLYSVAYGMIDQWREEKVDSSNNLSDTEPESTLYTPTKNSQIQSSTEEIIDSFTNKIDSLSNLSDSSFERKVSDLEAENDDIVDLNRSLTSLLSMNNSSSEDSDSNESCEEEEEDQAVEEEKVLEFDNKENIQNNNTMKKISLRERMSKKTTPTEEFNMASNTPVSAPQPVYFNQLQNNVVHIVDQMMSNQTYTRQNSDQTNCKNTKSGRNSDESTSDSETVKSNELKSSLKSDESKPKKKVSFLLEDDIKRSTIEKQREITKSKAKKENSAILRNSKSTSDRVILSSKPINNTCNEVKSDSKKSTGGYIDPSVLAFNEKHNCDVNAHIAKIDKQQKIKTPVLYTKKTSKNKNDEIIKSEFLEEQRFDTANNDLTLNSLKKFFSAGYDIISNAEDFKYFLKKKFIKTLKVANTAYIYFDINEEQNYLNGIILATKNYAACFNLTQDLKKNGEFLEFIRKFLKNSESTKVTYNGEGCIKLLNRLYPRDRPIVPVNLVDIVSTTTDDEQMPCFFSGCAKLSKTSKLNIQQLSINYLGYSSMLKFARNSWESLTEKGQIHLIAQALKFTQSIVEIYKFQCKKRNQLISHEFRTVRTARLSDLTYLPETKFFCDNSLNKEIFGKMKLDIKRKSQIVNPKNLTQESNKLGRTILTADKYFALKNKDNNVILVEL